MFDALPFSQLVQLMSDRHRLSMRDLLQQLAMLHYQLQAQGYELALEGHYRKAFEALQQQPRNVFRRLEAAMRLYVIALYAEQLEPREAHVHFATAYHELFAVVDLIYERYGLGWLLFPDLREQVYFFDAITAMTPPEHQRVVSEFYSRPYLLPHVMLISGYEYRTTPPQPLRERPHWFPRTSKPPQAPALPGASYGPAKHPSC